MLGMAVVGAVVGVAGRMMHPSGRVVRLPAALLLGVTGALGAFYAGRALHLFTDGQLLGWGTAIVGSAVLVALWGVVRPRR
jgi:uncharacterized membrane protein YeaQ/YmgE (transglycosylase-associated protein family)